MDQPELHAALTTLLADHGRVALLTLALASAELVLPFYEAHHRGDDRLRRALSPRRQPKDRKAAGTAMSEVLGGTGDKQLREMARVVYAAANLAFWDDAPDDTVLEEVTYCVRASETVIGWVWAAGSAQERLDFALGRMDGLPGFDAWLRARLERIGAGEWMA